MKQKFKVIKLSTRTEVEEQLNKLAQTHHIWNIQAVPENLIVECEEIKIKDNSIQALI